MVKIKALARKLSTAARSAKTRKVLRVVLTTALRIALKELLDEAFDGTPIQYLGSRRNKPAGRHIAACAA